MKLLNQTPYETRDLKKFVYACSRELRGGRKLCKDLTIRIETLRIPRWAEKSNNPVLLSPRGRAYYGKVGSWKTGGYQFGYLAMIKVPVNNEVNKRELAFVVMHELAHCNGEHHRQMAKKVYGKWQWSHNDPHYEEKSKPFAFADNLPLRLEEPPVRKTRNIRLERYQKALRKVKEYEAKERRTKTLLKKWQNKVKYYEKLFN